MTGLCVSKDVIIGVGVLAAGVDVGFCCTLTDKDRWSMSAPLAKGAQPRAGERTLDKRGGSAGKTSRVFCVLRGRLRWMNKWQKMTDLGGV